MQSKLLEHESKSLEPTKNPQNLKNIYFITKKNGRPGSCADKFKSILRLTF